MDINEILTENEDISHAVILIGDTKPDSCVSDIEYSKALNVEGIVRIINSLKERQIKPVFASTEVVYDGKRGHYTENDTPNPIMVYGQQKLAVEKYMTENLREYLILRLALVLSDKKENGSPLSKWIQDINNKKILSLAHDYVSSPVYVADVADAVEGLIRVGANGIFNVAGPEELSRLEIGKLLAESVKKHSDIEIEIVSCSIDDFDLKEQRPKNVSMSAIKLTEVTGQRFIKIKDVCDKLVLNTN